MKRCPETAPTKVEFWKNPRKRWSERRDSNACQVLFSSRQFPRKQSISQFSLGADLVTKRTQTNGDRVKLCQNAERFTLAVRSRLRRLCSAGVSPVTALNSHTRCGGSSSRKSQANVSLSHKEPRPKGVVLPNGPWKGPSTPRPRPTRSPVPDSCVLRTSPESLTNIPLRFKLRPTGGSRKARSMQFLSSIASVPTMPRGQGFLCYTKSTWTCPVAGLGVGPDSAT